MDFKPQDFREPEEWTITSHPSLLQRIKTRAEELVDPHTGRPSEVNYVVNQALEKAFPETVTAKRGRKPKTVKLSRAS